MPQDISDILKHSLMFSGLDGAEIGELARLSVPRSVEAGEFVFWEGDSPDWFYVVGEGRIRILKHSSAGKEFTIAFFGPGEMFGEVAVFENKPYPASAQAVAGSWVLGFRRAQFLAFLAERPEVALSIMSILGGRLRDAQSRLKDLAGERAEQRIAGILLMLYLKLGPDLPFTRQDIADMAGTTTETAIRVIGRFKDDGIISSSRGKMKVLDTQKLRFLTEGPGQV